MTDRLGQEPRLNRMMKPHFLPLAAALVLLGGQPPIWAEDAAPEAAAPADGATSSTKNADAEFDMSVEVGGAPMYASKTIIENAATSKDHTRFVADAETSGLAGTLAESGPFTVFAPVNRAFLNLPKATADALLKPENAAALKAVVAYHVLAGKFSAADFVAAIRKGEGKATFRTLEGEDLTIVQDGRRLQIIDARGDRAIVTISDVNQKNGVIHVIDTVLLPKS
ncbi:Fasciclin [Methylocella tundrae]|uniref:Fasciclin n=3 Tax=Methylocella tundrae TaxID=227605 RepID=A0A4U8Z2F9_METTU|nr:Fasciclin [Methylocella tundrae]